MNCLRGLASRFKWVLLIKLIIQKLLLLRGMRFTFAWLVKFLKSCANRSDNLDSLRFALMFALMNGTYKASMCAIRRWFNDPTRSPDWFAAPISGFLSGLWIGLDTKKRRSFLTILLLSRASDTIFNRFFQDAYTTDPEDMIFLGHDCLNKHVFVLL